jgi:cobyrinic acid a,c-diamide synthase
MSHLLISAAHKSSGKTTITLGLCAALHARGLRVRPYKKGPDYIDPMWLGMAAGRSCLNLDFQTQDNDEILRTFACGLRETDIGIVEGNMSLYDGMDLEGGNSNAALAKLIRAPVILVLDATGVTRGIAPLLLGYQAFDREVDIAGVILNQVAGQRHEEKLRAVISHYTDIPVLGAVRRNPELRISERHLGLVPSNELGTAREKIDYTAGVIAAQVDLDALIELAAARSVGPDPALFQPEPVSPVRHLRIAIARDPAFGFYYPGDLEALERGGAELVPVDTLRDSELPAVDGLFIGGGFPETHTEQLEANRSLRRSIRTAIEAGLPAYAECGGLMYLARSITWQGRCHEMVGVVPGDIRMHERPVGRGYIHVQETGEGPWPLRDSAGRLAGFHAHEFHHSSIENLDPDCRFAFRVLRGTGLGNGYDGVVYRNLLACYAHQRDVGANHWTHRFLEFVRHCRSRTAVRAAGG